MTPNDTDTTPNDQSPARGANHQNRDRRSGNRRDRDNQRRGPKRDFDRRDRDDQRRGPRRDSDRPERPPRVYAITEGRDSVVFVGQADPHFYFPDIISFFTRDDIDRVVLKSRGRAISNTVDVAERVRRQFLKDTPVIVAEVKIGTEQVERRDGKGRYPMSFIKVALARDEEKVAEMAAKMAAQEKTAKDKGGKK